MQPQHPSNDSIASTLSPIWQQQSANLRAALAIARRHLEQMLRADEERLHRLEPKPLNDALGPFGAARIDLHALSSLLRQRGQASGLAAERRARIASLASELQAMEDTCPSLLDECSSCSLDLPVEEIREATTKHLDRFAQCFRSLRIAQRETHYKYEAPKHKDAPESFDWRRLSPAERQLIPPFIAWTCLREDQSATLQKTIELLESGLPIKVVAYRSSLYRRFAHSVDPWNARPLCIETIPFALQSIHFQQTDPFAPDFERRLAEALRSPRAALISLLAPKANESESDFQKRAWNAVRSRGFPRISYNPDRASGFGTCFDLSQNPSIPLKWDQDPGPPPRAYTFAHYAATEPEFSQSFAKAPPSQNESLVPIETYLELPPQQQATKQPVLHHPPNDTLPPNATIAPGLLAQAMERARVWRALQEVSGHSNPFVENARLRQQEKEERKRHSEAQQKLLENQQASTRQTQENLQQTMQRLVEKLTGISP